MRHSPAAASDIAAARGGNAGRLTTVVDGRHRGGVDTQQVERYARIAAS
jgi:hypothetical protein